MGLKINQMFRSIGMSVFAWVFLAGGCALASDLNEFVNDGCGLFPNSTLEDRSFWCECCFNHDMAYWRGGSEQERKEADKSLYACALERTGNKTLAETMYDAVRFGGSSVFPVGYRWGYGWKNSREYKPLTENEQKQVVSRLDKYKKSHPEGYCRKQ